MTQSQAEGRPWETVGDCGRLWETMGDCGTGPDLSGKRSSRHCKCCPVQTLGLNKCVCKYILFIIVDMDDKEGEEGLFGERVGSPERRGGQEKYTRAHCNDTRALFCTLNESLQNKLQ